MPSPGRPPEITVFELRSAGAGARERDVCLLVVGHRASGKTALPALLAGQAASRDLGFGNVVPLLAPVDRLEDPRLDEAEISRLNPILGATGGRVVLAAGSALLIVDGLDQAASPSALEDSLADLARKYPDARIVAFTRPLPPKIPGRSETMIDGFVVVRMAGPAVPTVATIHELEDQRSEAHRVRRIATLVEELLDAWSFERLPKGAVLRRFTSRGRLLFASRIAAGECAGRRIEFVAERLQHAVEMELSNVRWFEDTEQFLHEDEHPCGGVPVDDVGSLANRIVDEIRKHPGVLVEKRPGVFSFADLAVQQHLAAIFFAGERDTLHLVEVRNEPWWHDVIVFATGLGAPWSSALPAKKLIRALLEASAAADSTTTFLAARCASAAPFLPPTLRAEIERRLRATIPPRSTIQMAHLIDDIGEVAAPALLAALPTATADERAFIATTLGRLDHPPSVRVLGRLVGDAELTIEPMLFWAWNVDAIALGAPVGLLAFAAFFNLALVNPAAYRTFDEVLGRTSREILATFVRLMAGKIVHDDFWGVDPEPERDIDRVTELVEKVVRASGG